MQIHPELAALLEQFKDAPAVDFGSMPMPEIRKLMDHMEFPLADLPMHEVRELQIPVAGHAVAARLYRPTVDQAAPVMVFFHGGGWCIGDLDTHDPVCRQLCQEAQCAVFSIDYRLAPEHRFPAAVEDCFAALRFVAGEGLSLGMDANRIAVGGDSAGGNLAAVCAIMARDADIKLAGQLLIYPATDWVTRYPSRDDFGEGFLLTEEAMRWFANNYIDELDHSDWRASPILAPDLSRLAPAFIFCGGCDPLLGESRAYAEKLSAAGTEASFTLYPGQIHAFVNLGGVIRDADKALAQSAEFLQRVFRR